MAGIVINECELICIVVNTQGCGACMCDFFFFRYYERKEIGMYTCITMHRDVACACVYIFHPHQKIDVLISERKLTYSRIYILNRYNVFACMAEI